MDEAFKSYATELCKNEGNILKEKVLHFKDENKTLLSLTIAILIGIHIGIKEHVIIYY